jgi:hypothetical protein
MTTDHPSDSACDPDLTERSIVAATGRPAETSGDGTPEVRLPRLVLGSILDQVGIFGSDGSVEPPPGERSGGSQRTGLTTSTRRATSSMNVELVVDESVSSSDLLVSAYLFVGADDGVVVVGDDARSATPGQDFVHESLWAVLGEAAARWDSSRPFYAPPA